MKNEVRIATQKVKDNFCEGCFFMKDNNLSCSIMDIMASLGLPRCTDHNIVYIVKENRRIGEIRNERIISW